MSRALKRLWKTIPLHRLKQGSSLKIRSRLPILHVNIEPKWRDDGLANLEKIFRGSNGETSSEPRAAAVQWSVDDAQEVETSLGRRVPHIIMNLFSEYPTSTNKTSENIFDDGENSIDGGPHRNDENSPQTEGTYLTIQTPESINLDVEIVSGNITIANKVEGDVKLKTGDGDITVKKIRGHKVKLESEGPTTSLIYAKSTLEAQDLKVSTKGRFRAKQCHGSNIEVDAQCKDPSHDGLFISRSNITEDEDDEGSIVDISSLFVSGQGSALIRTDNEQRLRRRAVRIKSHHGAIHVETKSNGQAPVEIHPHTKIAYPIIELGGVNGCCEVFCRRNEESSLGDESDEWNSCLLHVDSLLPDRINVLAADHGTIGVTLDRKVESDIRLASVPHSVAEASATVADEEDTELLVKILRNLTVSGPADLQKDANTVEVKTNAFIEGDTSFVSPDVVYRDGSVRNKSAEPDSRFDRRGAGKINSDAASAQAFAGFSADKEDVAQQQHPLLAVVGSKRIVVETVSWIGAIARRYGLDESEERELGRTASRRGREFTEQ